MDVDSSDLFDDEGAYQNVLTLGTISFSITSRTAGGITLTVNDISGATPFFADSADPITVRPNNPIKLQMICLGETAVPGTTAAGGVNGTASNATAGNFYTITINGVDDYWNINTMANHQVTIAVGDVNATLPSPANLTSGTRAFDITFKTASPSTITATDTEGSSIYAEYVHSAVTVSPDSANALQLLLPGETAAPGTSTGQTGGIIARTAGTAFTVTVNAVDANYNTNPAYNPQVSIFTTDLNDTHPVPANLSSGTKTFVVTLVTSGPNHNVTASSATLALDTSNTFAVNPALVKKLQLLVPGETAEPGTTSGKTAGSSVFDQYAGLQFTVSVNAVDSYWNVVTSASHQVTVTSTDVNAITVAPKIL